MLSPGDLDDPDARRMALAVAARLKAAGHQALFCGGAVRDRLLARTPGDYDVATSAPPEATAALFPHAVLVGAQFGTVVVPGAHHDVQVTTFRADGLYVDGRRPTGVVYADAVTDAQRRDFTVNGLFEEPETGRVIDHVGGLPDLEARLLRAIGDPYARFEEDHLRILRGVRQAAQLRFALEPATLRAIRDLAPRVASVAAERVRVELLKLLRHGRGRGLRLLRDAGLLPYVLPEVAAMQGVTQPPRWHPEGDVFVHTCLVLDGLPAEPPAGLSEDDADDLLLGALLHDVGKPLTRSVDPDGRIRFNGHDTRGAELARAVLERLRFPRRSLERVDDLVATHMAFPNLPRMRRGRLRQFLARPDLPLHLALHEADAGASHGDVSLAAFCREQVAALGAERALPPPLLTGADLLSLGYAPGPRLGRILRELRELQLEGVLEGREAAVRHVQSVHPPPPGTA